MKLTGMMAARNEDWIIAFSARAALLWLDELVILDHASTDGTPLILRDLKREYGDRLHLLSEAGEVWEEMRHRQRMLETARAFGATHLAIVDADEVLAADLLGGIRFYAENAPRGSILQIPWLCMKGDVDHVYAGGVWGSQHVSTAFEDNPAYHWAARAGYDFHHRHPMGRSALPFQPVPDFRTGLMHLQFVSERRLRAKQALYKLTEVLRWPGREPVAVVNERYNLAVYGDSQTRVEPARASWWSEVYSQMWLNYAAWPDAVPWQEARCRELVSQHGAQRFAGLDLFGVV